MSHTSILGHETTWHIVDLFNVAAPRRPLKVQTEILEKKKLSQTLILEMVMDFGLSNDFNFLEKDVTF